MTQLAYATLALAATLPLGAGCLAAPDSLQSLNLTRTLDGDTSGLYVPSACRIYASADSDAPRRPFHSPILVGCAVDSNQGVYGLVSKYYGDLAILPGAHELGLVYAFDSSVQRPVSLAALTGSDGSPPQVRAFAAAVNMYDPVDPYPELAGDGTTNEAAERRRDFRVIELGPDGVLLSLGSFTTESLQVAVKFNWYRLAPEPRESGLPGTYVERFYVNKPPPVLHRY